MYLCISYKPAYSDDRHREFTSEDFSMDWVATEEEAIARFVRLEIELEETNRRRGHSGVHNGHRYRWTHPDNDYEHHLISADHFPGSAQEQEDLWDCGVLPKETNISEEMKAEILRRKKAHFDAIEAEEERQFQAKCQQEAIQRQQHEIETLKKLKEKYPEIAKEDGHAGH